MIDYDKDFRRNTYTSQISSNSPIRNLQQYKIILIGRSGVGKTSIIQRLRNNEFSKSYVTTIGVEFTSKIIHLENQKNVKINVWDTSGQECFKSIVKSFYRNADAIIIVYNIASKESFLDCDSWLEEAVENGKSDAIKVLIGSQNDRVDEREVSKEEAQNYMKEKNFDLYFETSALQGDNIEEFFYACTNILDMQTQSKQQQNNDKSQFLIQDQSQGFQQQQNIQQIQQASQTQSVQQLQYNNNEQFNIKITSQNLITKQPSKKENSRCC